MMVLVHLKKATPCICRKLLLLFLSSEIGRVAGSWSFGTASVALRGMVGLVGFLLCHLRFLLSWKSLSSVLATVFYV